MVRRTLSAPAGRVTPRRAIKPADNFPPALDGRADGNLFSGPYDCAEQQEPLRSEAFVSIQIAILKVLSSHGSGRAPLASLNRDIAILTASGAEWSARIRRLAARVSSVDIFGQGLVVREDDGWQITPAGRDFMTNLEAVTQDNLPRPDEAPAGSADALVQGRASLIVVGHRFRNRVHRPGMPARVVGTASAQRTERVL